MEEGGWIGPLWHYNCSTANESSGNSELLRPSVIWFGFPKTGFTAALNESGIILAESTLQVASIPQQPVHPAPSHAKGEVLKYAEMELRADLKLTMRKPSTVVSVTI